MPSINEAQRKKELQSERKDTFSFKDFLNERNEKYKKIDGRLLKPDSIESPIFPIIQQPFISSRLVDMKDNEELNLKLRAFELSSKSFSTLDLYNNNLFGNIFSNYSVENAALYDDKNVLRNTLNQKYNNIFDKKEIAEFAIATKAFCRCKKMHNLANFNTKNDNSLIIYKDSQGKQPLFYCAPKEHIFRNLSLSSYAPDCITELNPDIISNQILFDKLSLNEFSDKIKKFFNKFEMNELEKTIFTNNYLFSLDTNVLIKLLDSDFLSSLEKEGVNLKQLDAIISIDESLPLPPVEEDTFLTQLLSQRNTSPLSLDTFEIELPVLSSNFQLFNAFFRNNLLLATDAITWNCSTMISKEFLNDLHSNYCDVKYGKGQYEKYSNIKLPKEGSDILQESELYTLAKDKIDALFSKYKTPDTPISPDKADEIIEKIRNGDSEAILSPEVISLFDAICVESLKDVTDLTDYTSVIAAAFPALSQIIQGEIIADNKEDIYSSVINSFSNKYLELGGSYRDLKYNT